MKQGGPLGLEDLTESRRRLSALGLFRRIQISAISHGDPSRRDVVVAVEEAQQTTIGGGGGLEIDRRLRLSGTETTAGDVYEFAPRGFFEIGRRNLGGRDRSVNLYTRLSLRPNTRSDEPAICSASPNTASSARIGSRARSGATATWSPPRRSNRACAPASTSPARGFNTELTHRLTPTIRGSARYAFVNTSLFDVAVAKRTIS